MNDASVNRFPDSRPLPMHFFYHSVLKDLGRHRDDPWKPAMWVGVPLVIGVLITMAMGTSSGPQVAVDLLVADEDDSFISSLVIRSLPQNSADGLFHLELVDRDAGRERVEQDRASALLVIPAGFGDALLKDEQLELLLVTNPAQRILPRIAEETIQILVDGAFYAHRILGDEINQMADWTSETEFDVSDPQISDISVRINRIVRRVESYLDPRVIELETSIDEEQKTDESQQEVESVSMAFYFFPGILIMALFFTGEGLSWDVWVEREQGTLRRVATTPRSLTGFLGAKFAAGAILIAAVSVLLLAVGLYYHDRPFTSLPVAAVWMVLSGCVLSSMMLLIQLFASSRRTGAVLTNAMMFPLLMLGGSLFPLEVMPDWMAALGRWTPNGWMLEHLKGVLLNKAEPLALARAGLALIALFALLFGFCCRRLYVIRSRT